MSAIDAEVAKDGQLAELARELADAKQRGFEGTADLAAANAALSAAQVCLRTVSPSVSAVSALSPPLSNALTSRPRSLRRRPNGKLPSERSDCYFAISSSSITTN